MDPADHGPDDHFQTSPTPSSSAAPPAVAGCPSALSGPESLDCGPENDKTSLPDSDINQYSIYLSHEYIQQPVQYIPFS